ncbi:50S ribosome-binding GTPase [Candidatus Woesearchaeota archaeon]|nr:50S ribosome-binding GTPase [Candidatus Woesearchaeota archaeon]
MSFQSINKVESAQKMLDIALKRVSKINFKKSKGDELSKAKKKELMKMDVVNQNVHSSLFRIIREFPALDNLSEFYSELLKSSLDFDRLKQCLGAVNWADNQAKSLVLTHKKKVAAARSREVLHSFMSAYLGRLSSVLKQVNPNLMFLEEARKILKAFPVIKQVPTVCIAGFPNVGKSTLLGKITTSKPEIQNYAFTTKTLNLGYFDSEKGKVQVIDTPGTLARPEKMNNIERQAYLAIKYQADLVVFVFDPTDTYELEKQEQLLGMVKRFRKPVLFYLSKTDIASKEKIALFEEKHDFVKTPSWLKEEIIKRIAE